jgi:gamma-glutamyltranspeptidase / glutathione hydrolase
MATFTTRPVITGRRGVVTAGHYLASMAGWQMLAAGGNAIDAGVAAGFALALLEPHNNGLGGEVPILVYEASTHRVHAISGQGTAPAAATIAWFEERGIKMIPGDGLLPATVPGALDGWVTALARFGTFSLGAVLAPALEMAESGFAMTRGISGCVATHQRRFQEEWPGSAAAYLPDERVPARGERFALPEWAATLHRLVDAE